MNTRRLIVELIHHETMQQLQTELDYTRAELKLLRRQHQDLERRYGYEVHLNSELCDLCRDNGIPYRPLLDNRNR